MAALISSILQIAVTLSSTQVIGAVYPEDSCEWKDLRCYDPINFEAPARGEAAGVAVDLDWTVSPGEDIQFSFRTNEPSGLILSIPPPSSGLYASPSHGILAFELWEGQLFLVVKVQHSPIARQRISQPGVWNSDGNWRKVSFHRDGPRYSLNITRVAERLDGVQNYTSEGEFSRQLTGVLHTGGRLFLGGTLTYTGALENDILFPKELYSVSRRLPFIGCLKDVSIKQTSINLNSLVPTYLSQYDSPPNPGNIRYPTGGNNVRLGCDDRTDKCEENHASCSQGRGVCYEGWNRFFCKCRPTYDGQFCDQSADILTLDWTSAEQGTVIQITDNTSSSSVSGMGEGWSVGSLGSGLVAYKYNVLYISLQFKTSRTRGILFTVSSNSTFHTTAILISQGKLVLKLGMAWADGEKRRKGGEEGNKRKQEETRRRRLVEIPESHFIADNKWHTVTVSIDDNNLLFWVDSYSVLKVRNLDINRGQLTTIQIGSDSLGVLGPPETFQSFIGYISQFTINNDRVFDIIKEPSSSRLYIKNSARFGHFGLGASPDSLVFPTPDSMFIVKQPAWTSKKYRLILEMEFKPIERDKGLLYFCNLTPKTISNKTIPENPVLNFLSIEIWRNNLRIVYRLDNLQTTTTSTSSKSALNQSYLSLNNQSESRKVISIPIKKQWNVLQVEVLQQSPKLSSFIVRLNGEPRTITAESTTDLFTSKSTEQKRVHTFGGIPYWQPKSNSHPNFLSPSGFVGCVRSIHINGKLIDRDEIDSEIGRIESDCVMAEMQFTGHKNNLCGGRKCLNRGVCSTVHSENGVRIGGGGGGRTRSRGDEEYCDCSLTTFRGAECSIDEAIFEFKSGLVEFSYPSHMKKDKERWQREYVKETEDTLAFSFSTEMPDCAILFVYSGSSSEYIKISLSEGRPLVEYRIGNYVHTVKDNSLPNELNDAVFHLVVFRRKGPNCSIQIDDFPLYTYTSLSDILSIFDDQAGVLVGGFRTKHQISDMRAEGVMTTKSGSDFVGMIRGLYLNGMRVLHYVAYQSPYSRIYGDVRWVNSDDIHFDIGDPFIQPEVDPSFDPKMEDCMFRLQIYPPCTSRNKDYDDNMREVTDRVPTATEPGDIKNSNNNNNNNPDCVTCAPSTGLDPTQNDQAGHQQTVKDGIRIGNSDDVKSRFDNDRGTDRLINTTRGIRMSTSAAGITIGIVTSVVMALLILIFAIYKMRHKAIIDQYGVAIEISEKNGGAPGKLPVLSTTNIDELNATGEHSKFAPSHVNSLPLNHISPNHSRHKRNLSLSHQQYQQNSENNNSALIYTDFVHKNGNLSNGNPMNPDTKTTPKPSSVVINKNNLSNISPKTVLSTSNNINGGTTPIIEDKRSRLRSNSGQSLQGSQLETYTPTRKPSYSSFTDGQLINMRDLSHLKEWYV
ncbi:neurexin-1-like isoform X4 [Convolutriloba macropyga]|uniref:neurexin-1-like isoform X4 n=1 Tax=Convolutriloba macropyga TaxID=536237 RepID=UPI003F528EF9